MLVDNTGLVELEECDVEYRIQNNRYIVQGFLYVEGYKSGLQSIKFIDKCLNNEKKMCFEKIMGAFTLCCIINDNIYMFTSNNNLNRIYLSKYTASASLLSTRDWHRRNNCSLTDDLISLCQYYTLGNVYFNRTLFKEIRALPSNFFIRWHNEKREILTKQIGDIDEGTQLTNPSRFFNNLKIALSNCNVAMALTGGYDSRLIFTYLYKQKHLKVALISNAEDSKEQIAAEKVANVGEKKLEVVKVRKPSITDKMIVSIIDKLDGTLMLSLSDAYIKACWEENFRKKAINVDISGDGGVLHKDWEWLSDFPFYHKKKTDLYKFYRQRISFLEDASGMGHELLDIYRNQERYFIKKMKQYARDINTESIDLLYYHLNGNRAAYYSGLQKQGVNVYAPLSEMALVRYSYNLPRRKRFYYNNMRKLITENNPIMARIPTDYGTTASSEIIYIFRDVFFQGIEYYKKAVRMIGRKVLRKSLYASRLEGWSFKEELPKLTISHNAIKWAKRKGYIQREATCNSLSYEHIERLVFMYVILKG